MDSADCLIAYKEPTGRAKARPVGFAGWRGEKYFRLVKNAWIVYNMGNLETGFVGVGYMCCAAGAGAGERGRVQ